MVNYDEALGHLSIQLSVLALSSRFDGQLR